MNSSITTNSPTQFIPTYVINKEGIEYHMINKYLSTYNIFNNSFLTQVTHVSNVIIQELLEELYESIDSDSKYLLELLSDSQFIPQSESFYEVHLDELDSWMNSLIEELDFLMEYIESKMPHQPRSVNTEFMSNPYFNYSHYGIKVGDVLEMIIRYDGEVRRVVLMIEEDVNVHFKDLEIKIKSGIIHLVEGSFLNISILC